jgi:hypothetical protein
MKKYTYIILSFFIVFLVSCAKDKDTEKPVTVENMSQLEVDQNFEWSAGMSGTLEVTFQNPNNVSTELEIINIVDESDNVIKSSRIADNRAVFS